MLRTVLPLVALVATAPIASPVLAQKAKPAPAAQPAADVAQRNAAANAPLPADQAAMKAHVLFLASDAMRGREGIRVFMLTPAGRIFAIILAIHAARAGSSARLITALSQRQPPLHTESSCTGRAAGT